jgi:hypothetical protein
MTGGELVIEVETGRTWASRWPADVSKVHGDAGVNAEGHSRRARGHQGDDHPPGRQGAPTGNAPQSDRRDGQAGPGTALA